MPNDFIFPIQQAILYKKSYSCAVSPTQNMTSTAHSFSALLLNDPHLLILLQAVRSFDLDLEKQVARSHPCCYRLFPEQRQKIPVVLAPLQIEPYVVLPQSPPVLPRYYSHGRLPPRPYSVPARVGRLPLE